MDVLAYKDPPGVAADIINNRGLLAALTDLNANVSPTDYGVSVLGIYPEGEALTDEVMKMIADAGYTEQVAVFKVEGVTFSEPLMIFYEPDFSFLRGGACTMYKYIPDIQKFVPGPNAMYDGYDRNFMDIENLHLADGEVNGTYAVVTQPLPAELVISTEEIQPLRDQLEQAEIQTSENAEKQDDNKVVTASDKGIKVDFAYSGKLPEGTKVTITLPNDATEYKETNY